MGYLFPGTVIQILLFASIFSTISIIQDRQQGFLQGVLVAPVSRAKASRFSGVGDVTAAKRASTP